MSAPDDSISVLLPVHAGVHPEYLSAALDSIAAQTRPPDEVVVVEDGRLPDASIRLLDGLERDHPCVVRVRLATNQGAGVANGVGLRMATGTWIAKVDADDILLPHRFASQWTAVATGDIDVCGAAMREFEGEPSNIVGIRTMPADDAAIRRRMRYNNPINHPTAMYRRDLALAAGGYGALRYMQDYDLFARMSVQGARMTNLPEHLVLFRAGEGVISRRRWSSAMAEAERTLQANLHLYGVVSRPRALFNYVWRSAYRRLPSRLIGVVHRRWLSRLAPVPAEAPEIKP